METNTQEFVKLIDRASEISQQMLKDKQSESSPRLNNVINALQSIKTKALNGKLEPSGGVSTLGLAREVADWIEPLDSPLLKAVGSIEEYYQQHL
ncbi:hypothetical protein VF14_12780 [Nostoc linckia z18]|jgi:hypothetical protein|uniref:Uncharacterized protein n=3 Tax=Nostoc TaxID=1177 RepID=A0A9Q5Z9Q5_NOSLI|nr:MULTISPECIES: hypothetical protein [Nostoc]MBL1201132.1 hypothetical protein [Nostoc sp. GBBB01]MDZ8011566.1 hypothetical protein [Nostoc sp. ZfuVER08]PHK40403.1 hypothetical protein VF12_10750 [Nostoc linckia z15]PHK48327.1 hypothetical protein VF13_01095 [Nostoc linckia z16]MBC1236307.1 hypothetical protein [Nostoc sp. 2RC]